MGGKDIHKFQSRVESALRRLKNGNINKENREDILEFYNVLMAEAMSIGRIAKYLNHLMKMGEWMKRSFRKAEKKDIIEVLKSKNIIN